MHIHNTIKAQVDIGYQGLQNKHINTDIKKTR